MREAKLAGFPGYAVRDDGTVVSLRTGRVLKPSHTVNGFTKISIGGTTLSLAAEVASAFVGPKPEGYRLAFLDGDSKNCRADNLAWQPTATHIAKSIGISARSLRKR